MRPPDDAPAWFAPPEADVESPGAPEGETVYRLIGSRWVVAVLHELHGGPVRYNALHRRLGGVSHKVLTQTLRRLMRTGIVSRRAHPTTPPYVEYELTASGAELLRNLERREQWAGARGLLD